MAFSQNRKKEPNGLEQSLHSNLLCTNNFRQNRLQPGYCQLLYGYSCIQLISTHLETTVSCFAVLVADYGNCKRPALSVYQYIPKAHLSVVMVNKCVSPEVSIVNHFRHLPSTYFLFHVFCVSTACAYRSTHTLVRIIITKRICSIHSGQTQGTKSSSCCN